MALTQGAVSTEVARAVQPSPTCQARACLPADAYTVMRQGAALGATPRKAAGLGAPKVQDADVFPGDSFPQADHLSSALRVAQPEYTLSHTQGAASPSCLQTLQATLSKRSKPTSGQKSRHGRQRVVTSSDAAVAAASTGNPFLAAQHRVSCRSWSCRQAQRSLHATTTNPSTHSDVPTAPEVRALINSYAPPRSARRPRDSPAGRSGYVIGARLALPANRAVLGCQPNDIARAP